MENPRRIYNPVQKDYVTFLKTAAETQGEYTLVEVELSPGGGVGIHYHKTYSEKFDCLDGELKVQAGKTIHTLSPGQTSTAHPNINHRFFNTSDKVCKFRVELRPASAAVWSTDADANTSTSSPCSISSRSLPDGP